MVPRQGPQAAAEPTPVGREPTLRDAALIHILPKHRRAPEGLGLGRAGQEAAPHRPPGVELGLVPPVEVGGLARAPLLAKVEQRPPQSN